MFVYTTIISNLLELSLLLHRPVLVHTNVVPYIEIPTLKGHCMVMWVLGQYQITYRRDEGAASVTVHETPQKAFDYLVENEIVVKGKDF